jgi:hypothetical protein
MKAAHTSDMSKGIAEQMVNPTSSSTRIIILGSGFVAFESLEKASECIEVETTLSSLPQCFLK